MKHKIMQAMMERENEKPLAGPWSKVDDVYLGGVLDGKRGARGGIEDTVRSGPGDDGGLAAEQDQAPGGRRLSPSRPDCRGSLKLIAAPHNLPISEETEGAGDL